MEMIAEKGYLERLVDDHYQALYRFGFSLSGNAADAADLTQQTFYIAQVKLHQLRDGKKVKTWLFTTLMREFLQKRRHETKFPKCELEQAEDDLPMITTDHAARMDSATVVSALQRLEENFRVPLVLFYLEGISYKEIAQVMELPVGTVMSRLARGRAQLRCELEKEGGFGKSGREPRRAGGTSRRWFLRQREIKVEEIDSAPESVAIPA